MRVLICWTGVSGYMRACWDALASRPDIDLRVIAFRPGDDASAPFHAKLIRDPLFTLLSRTEASDLATVAEAARAHRPDVVVVSGWAEPAYRALRRDPALRNLPFVMAMDTPRRHTWRQTVGRTAIGRFVRGMARVVVAGERSWQYARYLGVPEGRIRRGVYGYDDRLFGPALAQRKLLPEWPRRFLYVGRYAPEKAIDVLLAAYRAYRTSVRDAWPLSCCGQGPERESVARADGVTDVGFVQPDDQPRVFVEHGVYVIASRYEPWGVAIAEAAASGLPVICTEACGAGLDVVRSYHNGLTVTTDDEGALAVAMRWMHDNHPRLPTMGEHGRALAAPFAAERWAERWAEMFRELLAPVGRGDSGGVPAPSTPSPAEPEPGPGARRHDSGVGGL